MSEHTHDEAAPSTVEEVASRAIQTPKQATVSQLLSKPRRTYTFPITIADEDGEPLTLNMKFRAISAKEYDDLIAACPPSPKEKQAGAVYNIDTFAPALIAAVSAEPKISLEEATELYKSPEWAGGEISALFINAQRVCNTGLDIPFNARD